jgi:hypothetical protein
MSQLELEIMLSKLDITDQEDQQKVFLKDILLIEEVEQVGKTDQENKEEEEETLVMLKTNFIKKNIKNQYNKVLPQQLNNLLLSKLNHKNPKN